MACSKYDYNPVIRLNKAAREISELPCLLYDGESLVT